MAPKKPKPQSAGPITLSGFNLGYNGYSLPTLLGPRQWVLASNVYSGQHGAIKRLRLAQLVNSTTTNFVPQGIPFSSLYNFRDPSPTNVIIADLGNFQYVFNTATYTGALRQNGIIDPNLVGVSQMAGPWSRATLLNILFEMNGQVKQTGRGPLGSTFIENLGLDTPDSSPAITTSAGAITKTVGRSYAYAFENVSKVHVSAPSPASAFVAYSSQQGTVNCIQAGTLNAQSAGTTVITGTGTAFTSAWVGRRLWIDGNGGSQRHQIVSVQSPTQLTLAQSVVQSIGANSKFAVYDPQLTHIRLYATADGGAIYFRIARNAFVESQTTLALAGWQFTDNSNAEPPNSPFTSETSQLFNIPPPIGAQIFEYQSRLIVYKVGATPQSFYYSNIELTQVGNPPESYAPLNQITLPIGDAQLQAMAAVPTGLIIWSDKHDMFKLTGLLSDNSITGATQLGASIQRLPYAVGAAGPFATAVTPLGVFWLTSDKEVYLFTDQYAPRNVGRPVQNILSTITSTQLSDARMVYFHQDDRNWLALAVSTNGALKNNQLLVLDLDMLSSNGQASFFVFDMASNQPTWYLFDVECESIVSIFDSSGLQHLVAGGTDNLTDVAYKDGSFKLVELIVPALVTLHSLGNDTSNIIKSIESVRFITNRDASVIQNDGWTFRVDGIDDDVYTFNNPLTRILQPGVNSPTLGSTVISRLPSMAIYYNQGGYGKGLYGGDSSIPGAPANTFPATVTQRPFQFSPQFFLMQGMRYMRGRRFRFSVNFPNTAGVEYELREIQLMLRQLNIK